MDTRAGNAADATVNGNELVSLSATSLTFEPWTYSLSFTVTVGADWNSDLPNAFNLKYTLDGTDKDAFLL